MKIFLSILAAISVFIATEANGQQKRPLLQLTPAGKGYVNIKVDNIGYWKRMVDRGYAVANPPIDIPKAVYTGSTVKGGLGVTIQDSPDIPVTAVSYTTQSENSVFVDPLDEDRILNSNNSTDWDGSTVGILHGSDYLLSVNAGQNWNGTILGPENDNSGDPATAISTTGRMYIGSISTGTGQSVSWSEDNGSSWHEVIVASVPSPQSDILDKNHLWVDNSLTSPWQGNVYDAWSCFVAGSANENEIELSRSTNGGTSWTTPINLSMNVHAGSHNQGVNLQTGPDGQVYAVWAIYDAFPGDESALGFAKSINGGSIFPPATRIINNIKGIRNTLTTKPIRVNSFPSMAVDISNGPNRGNLYVVWANIGVPGVNTGNDIDVYMLRSTDAGDNWSAPIRINQDPSGFGKDHFFPWITCDPQNGNLAVIYYDDRNVASTNMETWISYSYDAGNTWSDMKVGDYSFTPAPIAGLAGGYFGDYLGISSQNMKVYPTWTDNRTGTALTYVSPINMGPSPNQPYVAYVSNELTPVSGTGSTGLNYGDSLFLALGLGNIGDQPSINTMAYLSCNTPYVQITDSLENYGDMAVGEVKTLPSGYRLKVSDTIPDGLRVMFNVRATDGTKTWVSHFTLEAHAPALKILNLAVNDTATGNHNGRLDPGESVQIKVNTSNTGDFICQSAWIKLSTTAEGISIPNDSVYIGTINPGDRKPVRFDLSVSDDVPFGTVIDLTCTAYSGLYISRRSFQENIGLFVEDWETGNFLKFPWIVGDTASGWRLTTLNPFEGVYSAKSGPIPDYDISELKITYTSGSDDSISFYRRVSSESGYDFLNFYIDNQLQGAWSGEKPWTRFSFPVTAGVHNFIWDYQKDVFTSAGEDAAWIDYIGFPPPVMPLVNVPRYDTLCAGQLYQTLASASGYDSIRWATTGDGVFSNDNTLTPVYTPGTNDVSSGSAKLKLTAFGLNGNTLHSTTLTIGGYPAVNISVLPHDTLCKTQKFRLSVDSVPGSHYLWTPGNFTTYSVSVDTMVAGGIGTHLFRVTVTNLFHCTTQDSVTITYHDCTGIADENTPFSYHVYPNPSAGEFTLSLFTPVPEKLDLSLQTVLNTTLYEEKGISVSGNFSKTFDLKGIPAGIYFLIIDRPEGRITRRIGIFR